MSPTLAPGMINVDKPWGWTSHDVVSLVRRLTGLRRVGHAGTLDPRATGVLVVMIGEATRLSEQLARGRKCYLARIRLGVTTSTDDGDGEVLATCPADNISVDMIAETLPRFLGEVMQTPPTFAAVKQQGVPAYKRARRGEAVALAPRAVRIEGLALLRLADALLEMLVWCGPGTYIRALARDLGAALGCGASLDTLRRLSSGSFSVDGSHDEPALRRAAAEGTLAACMTPLDAALDGWPAVIVGDDEAAGVAHGGVVPAPAAWEGPRHVRLYAPDGRLLALCRYDAPRQCWQPYCVFAQRMMT